MNTNISESMLSSFSTAFAAERANQVAQKAVVKSGLSAAAENQKENRRKALARKVSRR